jgi:hypothetical protein
MGMSAFFAFDAFASSKPSKEKIAVQNFGYFIYILLPNLG